MPKGPGNKNNKYDGFISFWQKKNLGQKNYKNWKAVVERFRPKKYMAIFWAISIFFIWQNKTCLKKVSSSLKIIQEIKILFSVVYFNLYQWESFFVQVFLFLPQFEAKKEEKWVKEEEYGGLSQTI